MSTFTTLRRRVGCQWLFGMVAVMVSTAALSTPTWVQDSWSNPQWNVVSHTVAFTRPQTAGNLNYVAIGWIGAHTVLSVTDTQGNTYVPATTVVTGPSTYQQVIFYAKNIAASASNSVTAKFDSPVSNLDMRIVEYTGLSTTNAFDVAVSATGTGTNTDSGSLTTTNANDFLIASNKVDDSTTGPGTGYSQEFITDDGDIVEFRAVSATGTYNATAPQGNPNPWIMQLVAFRDAGSPAGGDSTAPSAPTGLSATASLGTPVNLSWTGSTDNVGVTAYVVDRCQGVSCSNYSPIAIPSGTSYSDNTGWLAATSYTYRVRAIDAAGNISSAATATVTSPSITFVQGNFGDPQGNVASVSVPFTAAQTLGDLNVVAVAWTDVTSHVTSVTDTVGNTYTLAVGPTGNTQDTQSIYYAKNIGSAAAGANTVTVTFDAAVSYPDIQVLEYSGLDTASPLDKTATGTGSGWTASAGPVTTTAAKEVIVASVYFNSAGSGAGSGSVLRVLSNPDTDVVEDQIVGSTGSYSATAAAANNDYWVMSITTFKAASGGADTSPPTAPSGLTPTVISSTQINLSWTASTDNVGVTGYKVERCQGTSCTTFAQIATPSTTTFSDTGLTASTAYRYRVRATDAAGNLSGYSNIASATTSSGGDTTPPSAPSNLQTSGIGASVVHLTWTASTDNVGVTGYKVERCQGVSCSTFAQIGTPGTNSYTDSGLTAATSYRYRVRATDAAGNLSGYSSTASATTASGLSTPSGLGASAVSSIEVDLSWVGSTGGAGTISYQVESCTLANCSSFSLLGTSTTTTFNVMSLTGNTSYSFRVRATDTSGDLSAYSSTFTLTTPLSGPDCN